MSYSYDSDDSPIEKFDEASVSSHSSHNTLAKSVGLSPSEALFEIICVFSVLYLLPVLKILAVGVDMSKYSRPLGADEYMSLLSQGLLATLIIGFILHKNRQPASSIGLHLKDIGGEIAIAIIVLLGIFAAIWIAGLIASFTFDANQLKEINQNNVKVAKMFSDMPVWLIPPFCLFIGYYEELIFRGFFISRLSCIFRNDWVAMVIAAAVFASAHFYQGVFKVILIFGLACVLGTLFVLRRSLIAPMIIHSLFDFTFMMMAKFAVK